jgi:cysteine desulfurase/selenocysteine lyase
MVSIQDFKHEFKARQGIHFNSAGASPISQSVAERISVVMTRMQQEGSLVDPEWIPLYRETRARFASFIGADVSEIAFTQNAATALSQAALGFDLKASDQVVTVDQEYASNFYPWKVACDRSGAKLVVVKSEPDQQISVQKLKAAIVPGVKLVGVSWVQFQTGTILDLKELGDHCHSVGAYLIVDAIQGIGQLPFSFRDLPVDFVAGGSHKWLCSVHGQGYFAVKKEFMQKLKPILVGCGTFNRYGTYADVEAQIESTARQFEPGGLSYMLCFALDSAIQVLQKAGSIAIEAEIARLSKILREGLLERRVDLATHLDQRGGITSFRLPIEAEARFLGRAKEEQIAFAKRGEFLRLSLHAFCNDAEVERVLQLIQEIR